MEKKIATYLLGVAMGIIIMAFLNVLIFDTNTNEKALLDLKKSYESLLEEKNNLQAQVDVKADETDRNKIFIYEIAELSEYVLEKIKDVQNKRV